MTNQAYIISEKIIQKGFTGIDQKDLEKVRDFFEAHQNSHRIFKEGFSITSSAVNFVTRIKNTDPRSDDHYFLQDELETLDQSYFFCRHEIREALKG
jgi:hypothetical protein